MKARPWSFNGRLAQLASALALAVLLALLALGRWRIALAVLAGALLAWVVARLARPRAPSTAVTPVTIDADEAPGGGDQNKVSTTVSKQ